MQFTPHVHCPRDRISNDHECKARGIHFSLCTSVREHKGGGYKLCKDQRGRYLTSGLISYQFPGHYQNKLPLTNHYTRSYVIVTVGVATLYEHSFAVKAPKLFALKGCG